MGWSHVPWGRDMVLGKSRDWRKLWETDDYIGKKPLGRERLEALPHMACIEHA